MVLLWKLNFSKNNATLLMGHGDNFTFEKYF